MPIFEYSCQNCGARFEKLVRRAEEAGGIACPTCGQSRLRQELSVFAAHANGAPKAAPAPAGPCSGCPNTHACGFGD